MGWKMTEEKISKNVTDIRSVATLANRIKEPRLLRMYKRESELFDELAISSRKALKSLSALILISSGIVLLFQPMV